MTRLSDVRDRIKAVEDEDYGTDAFIGIYGEPGTGKTILAVQLALQLTDANVLVLDTSDNGLAIRESEIALDGVDVYDLESADATAVIAAAFRNGDSKFSEYGAVVVDEGSSVAKMLLDGYVRERDGLAPDEPVGDFEAKYYGAAASLVRQFFYNLKATDGLHVIVVSHERKQTTQVQGDFSKTTVMIPEYWPTALTEVQKLMHVHARLTTDVTTTKGKPVYRRELQSLPTPTVAAKTKFGMPVYSSPEEWITAITNQYNK